MRRSFIPILLLFLFPFSLVFSQTQSPNEAKCGGKLIKMEQVTGGDTIFFPGVTNSNEAKKMWKDSIIASNGGILTSDDPNFEGTLCPGCPDNLPGCEVEFSNVLLNAPNFTDSQGNTGKRVFLSSPKNFTYKCASCRVDQSAINGMVQKPGANDAGTTEAQCGGDEVRAMEIVHPSVHTYEVEAPNADSAAKMWAAIVEKDNGNGWAAVDEERTFGCPLCVPDPSSCEMNITRLPAGALVSSLGGGKFKVGTSTGEVTIDYKCESCDDPGQGQGNGQNDPNGDDDGDGIPNSEDLGKFTSAFPNPTSNFITFDYEILDQVWDVRIDVKDPMMGPVMSSHLGPMVAGVYFETMNLSMLPPGPYNVILWVNSLPVDMQTIMKF